MHYRSSSEISTLSLPTVKSFYEFLEVPQEVSSRMCQPGARSYGNLKTPPQTAQPSQTSCVPSRTLAFLPDLLLLAFTVSVHLIFTWQPPSHSPNLRHILLADCLKSSISFLLTKPSFYSGHMSG